jgi:hypothetical protein
MNKDRLSLVLLARCTQFLKQAILIIQPDTLLCRHRASPGGCPGGSIPTLLAVEVNIKKKEIPNIA